MAGAEVAGENFVFTRVNSEETHLLLTRCEQNVLFWRRRHQKTLSIFSERSFELEKNIIRLHTPESNGTIWLHLPWLVLSLVAAGWH